MDEPLSSPHTALERRIFQKIEADRRNSISFSEFIGMALYDPEEGYYASGDHPREIGRAGDFYTSVSVGNCFGYLMSRAICETWLNDFNAPDSFAIVEQGGHDGRLALDILEAIAEISAELSGRIDYYLIEESAIRRDFLRESIGRGAFSDKLRIVPSASDVKLPAGVFLCNELIDAFPVNRVRFVDGAWKEQRVARKEGRFVQVDAGIESGTPLFVEIERIGTGFSEGYTTEICMALTGWAQSVAPIFQRGIWWVVDYGFEAAEYFAPERREGTLRCYRNHSAADDPFEGIGESDITAHVNFSSLSRAMESAGFRSESLTDQHDFLTRAAAPWLQEMEANGTTQDPGNRKRLRQFQTLTHPGMLGRVFKVAEFRRGL